MPEQLLTRAEAAQLCGCSVATIRRRQNAGDYSGAEQIEGTWYIPVADLVAAGDCFPTGMPDVSGHVGDSAGEIRIAGLEAALARAEAEIEFQRTLLLQLTARPKDLL